MKLLGKAMVVLGIAALIAWIPLVVWLAFVVGPSNHGQGWLSEPFFHWEGLSVAIGVSGLILGEIGSRLWTAGER